MLTTRHKDVEHIRLLRQLWPKGNAYKRACVIDAYIKATRLEPDLKAELEMLQHKSEATKRNRHQQWQRAVTMVAKRNAAAAGTVQQRDGAT